MAKDKKSTATPRLRFPEFRNTPGWNATSLSDAIIPVVGRVGERKLTPVSISAGIGFVSQTEKFGRDISGNQYALYTLAQDGDFVYNKGNSLKFPQGCVYQLHGWGEVAVPNVFICFRLKKGFVDSFVQACFEKNIHGLQLKKHITSGARSNGLLNISKEHFFGVKIPTPPLADEQQKIADCLTSLAEVIAAQRRKVEALKAYKRGMVQQLFPREGEALPRLRFLDAASNSVWHTQKISSLLTKVSVPVSVSPEEIYREIGIRSHGKGIFHKKPVEGKVIGTKRVFRVVENALIVNIVFAWEQAVATTSKRENGMIASHRFPMYVANPDKCDVRYMKEFFLTKAGKHLLGLASPGGAGRNKTLGLKEFENLKIALPETVAEQARIADYLSYLDTQIATETEKFETLKAHKKGLMQQLLPMPEEN